MKITLRFTLFTVLLAVAGSGLWYWLKDQPAVSMAPGSAPLAMQWQQGDSQAYIVAMDSSMRLNTGAAGPGGPAQAVSVELAGRLMVQTLAVKEGVVNVGMQLSDALLVLSGQEDPDAATRLGEPFRVAFTDGGIPGRFEFTAATTTEDRVILENLVRTFQVSMSAGNDTWQVREYNASGSFDAVYRRTANDRFSKQKQDLQAPANQPLLQGARIQSTESFTLPGQGSWLASMLVEETLVTAVQGQMNFEVSNSASLALDRGATVRFQPLLWQFAAAEAAPVEEQPGMTPAQARRQLVATVPSLDAANQGRSRHIHELRDLLRLDPSVPPLLLQQLQSESLKDRTRADLYLALELAGTPAAQQALVTVISDPSWSSVDAMRAIVALADVAEPTEDSVRVLWDTAVGGDEQLASTATYALGSVGNTLRSADDPDYETVRQGLVQGAYSSSDQTERVNYLLAIGNTRDSALAQDVSTMLADDDAGVRRAAALSLGMLGDSNQGEELLKRFREEGNASVRGAIAESMTSLAVADEESMATIGSAIRVERQEEARYAMASFLVSNLDKHPQYRDMLQQLNRQEPSKRIRKTIAEGLASSTASNG